MISKQKEIFNELVDERLEEITDLDKKVNSDGLIYRYKGNTSNVKFDQFDNAFSLLDKMRDGKISLTNAKNDQAEFKLDLNEIKKKETKNIDQKSKKLHCIILKCSTKQETVLLFFWWLFFNGIWSKLKATKETVLKILTPKQVLQRLPIALAQVKAGNNSENLLNEIREIVYCLYQSKEITKNIIKSI